MAAKSQSSKMPPTYDAVAFDGMGVLYKEGDDVVELLIPYLRDHGCTKSNEFIGEVYTRASEGQLTSAGLWTTLGAKAASDETYLASHELNPGMEALLARLSRHGVPLACLSNDLKEWSRWLRHHLGLEQWVSTWVISGEIGVRKPQPGAYEALIRACRVSAERIMFIDDRKRNVEAAAKAGLQAVLFDGDVDKLAQTLGVALKS